MIGYILKFFINKLNYNKIYNSFLIYIYITNGQIKYGGSIFSSTIVGNVCIVHGLAGKLIRQGLVLAGTSHDGNTVTLTNEPMQSGGGKLLEYLHKLIYILVYTNNTVYEPYAYSSVDVRDDTFPLDLPKNVTHSRTGLTNGLQRDGLGDGEPASLSHVNLDSINSIPVEALDQRAEHQPHGPQRERLAGTLAPAHPERHQQPALRLTALEPLGHELGRRVPHGGVPVDRVDIDEQHRAGGHVVAANLAVRGRLVRQQQRRRRV
jgi:hypothetical protein